MSARIMTFSLPESMFGEIDRTLAAYNAATDASTTRSGYIRLAVADRLRRDAERVKGYCEVNRIASEIGVEHAR